MAREVKIRLAEPDEGVFKNVRHGDFHREQHAPIHDLPAGLARVIVHEIQCGGGCDAVASSISNDFKRRLSASAGKLYAFTDAK